MQDDDRTLRISIESDAAATMIADPLATLRPSRGSLDAAEEKALRALFALVERGGLAHAYTDFEAHLGTGAMGLVRVAEQPGMGRKVAVKTLQPRYTDEGAVLRLLQEAWITGSLEHPNIVPVYEMAIDADRNPQVVMRRIEGEKWRDLLYDPERLAPHLSGLDPLEWHLRRFVEVCKAVHFAHARGIVHRDLKPENVMIGAFGDVYVMDWGIAVSTREEDVGRVPLAWAVTEMAGTPGYMAPEMLDGEPPHVSPATDVYLLGATLYEIVARRAPHRGENLMALVKSIVRSEPDFPADAPPPLVAICQRAMTADPDARFASAEALGEAVQDFLRGRGSARLCYEASLKLSAFEAQLLTFVDDLPADVARDLEGRVAESTLDGPPPDEDPRARRARLYDLFGASRFGFQQALEEGPDNVVAKKGLRRVLSLMAEHELAQGNLSAAELLAMEVARPPRALRARLKAAEHDEERRLQDMERLRREHDPNVGARSRATVALVFGVMWTVAPILGALIDPRGLVQLATTSLWTSVFLGLGVAFVRRYRQALTASALNRGILAAAFLSLAAQILLNLGVYLAEAPVTTMQTTRFLLWCLATSMVALVWERRLWPAAAGYGLGYLACARWPAAYYPLMSICNLVFTVNAGWVWWPRARAGTGR